MTAPCLYGLILMQLFFLHFLALGQKVGMEHESGLRLLGPNVNTPEDEFVDFRYADKLFFSSETKDESTGKKKTRSFSVLRQEPAHPLLENPKENQRHMAHLAFNLKADRMYYSILITDWNDQLTSSEIWYQDRNYDGSWGAKARPPEPLNQFSSLAMHPVFGFDRTSGKELLFFVSDRPGGKGGLDIWVSEIKRGRGDAEDTFTPPMNLPFNTSGDEVTPHFDTQSQTLFFSSDGRQGWGGQDVFRVKKGAKGKWATPQNLRSPVNSPSDDQCFSFHHPSGLAYFSSNRPQGPSGKKSAPDFDVYQIDLKAEVRINLLNAHDQSPLAGCNVELLEPQSDRVLETQLNLPAGQAVVQVEVGKPYRVIVSKMGYLPVYFDLLTSRDQVFSDLEKTVLVKPMRPSAVRKVKTGN